MKRSLLFLLGVSIIFIGACIPQQDNNTNVDKPSVLENKKIISEKEFYKKSDLGTDVFRLTTDLGNDNIFYQNPNYFNPESSLFLFKSDRGDGKYRLYLLNVSSGEIILLRKGDSFGHMPTWSIDGKQIYIGERGKIIVLDITTRREKVIDVPENSWITFLDINPAGDTILFVEEDAEEHKGLSIIGVNGYDYHRLFSLNNLKSTQEDFPFYLDHPLFIDNNNILFLTRGKNRDFTRNFNKPYIVNLRGGLRRLSRECSHYDVNLDGNKILCASEGYIIDLEGNILKSFPEIKGHGVWSHDGDTFLMTGDPVPVPSGQYFGKIVLMKFSSPDSFIVVSHESTYNSSLPSHIQPNAQFSPNGDFIIYESDRGRGSNSDLYLVETNFNTAKLVIETDENQVRQ